MSFVANPEEVTRPNTAPGLRSRVHASLRAKLGRCPLCMRWSALGMVSTWVAAAFAALSGGPIGLTVALAIAAIAFTIVFVLHITTFTARVLRGPDSTVDVARRQFLVTSAKVGGVAVAASISGAFFHGIALATRRDNERGNSFCAKLCQSLFPPGPQRGRCISEGAQGRGICFEGTCVPPPPASGEFKQKQTQEEKLQSLLAGNPTSSTLAGSFFHTAQRFLENQAPANDFETRMFPLFVGLSESTRQVLACSVQRFGALSESDRVTLFGTPFADTDLEPIAPEVLVDSLAGELRTILLADPRASAWCDPETPGLIRPITYVEVIEGGAFTLPVPWIDRIDSRRTKAFLVEGGGQLPLADYTVDEIEQACQPDPAGQVCEVTNSPCPPEAAGFALSGYEVDGVCLRVGTVVAGDTITLEGLNYYDVNARVRLSTPVSSREVEAVVCGDTTTPLLDSSGVVIADSRVKDVLGFTVPADLADGLYEISVIVINPNDTAEHETPLGYRPYIRVLAPFTGRFQITSERLRCISETGSTSIGSDEIGIRTIATPIRLSGILVDPTTREFRFSDVDNGETRELISTSGTGGSRIVLDADSADLFGVIVTVMGYEIDGEDAYQQQITDFWELYVHFLIEEIKFLALALGPVVLWFGISGIAAIIAAHPILTAIAAAIVLAIPVFIALWAPADAIIEDHIALSQVDLLQMTSVSFPPPFGPPYTSQVTYAHGIDVNVIEVEKAQGELREERRYRSSEEDSSYTITLRYNRMPGTTTTITRAETAAAAKMAPNGAATLEVEGNASSHFTFHWKAAGYAREAKSIRIYDVMGRLRSQIGLGTGNAGSMSWSGIDGRGTQLPAGVYFAVFSGAGGEPRRIVLVR